MAGGEIMKGDPHGRIRVDSGYGCIGGYAASVCDNGGQIMS